MSEQITFRIPRDELATLDEVTRGRYRTRADAIRAALRLLVKAERDRLIRESYVRAYESAPQEEWIGEAGAGALAEAVESTGPSRSGRTCECGCGGTPRRGRFLPGHDAKLMSRLKRAAESGDPEARKELERRGWT